MIGFIEEGEEFRREVTGLFIKNLNEFRDSLPLAIQQGDHTIYLKAHHKIKVTLGYVDHQPLNDVVTRIAIVFKEFGIEGIGANVRNAFYECCTSAIKGLESELATLHEAMRERKD